MIIGRVEKSAHELKSGIIKEIHKFENSAIQNIRNLRNDCTTKMRRIKAIASKDDVQRMTSTVDAYQTRYTELARKSAADKERDIRSAE